MVRHKQLTIVCITADLIPGRLGGAESHVVEVIRRLSRRHKILLFVGPDISIKEIIPKNIEVYPVSYPKIPNFYGLAFIIFGYSQIAKILDQKKFDLLWAKQCFPQAPLAAWLNRSFNKPFYVTAQNPQLHLEELIVKGSRLLQFFQKPLASLLTPLISWSLRQADLVAAVSSYSAKLAKKMGVSQTTVIPNGVDLDKFKKLKRVKQKQFTIVTTSSLIPRNGIDILVDAVALLPRDFDWQLLIAGEGLEGRKLKLQVTSYKLQDRVKFLGRVDNKNIPGLLARADLFVRPSRKEGFGVAFLEAMAAGVPIIGTTVGGITDFVSHKQTGLLISPSEVEELSQAIIELYQDKELSRKLAINAKKLIRGKYQWDIIARQIDKQMVELVDEY